MEKNKKLLILNGLLVFGLLVYSTIFLVINKNFNPLEISGSDYDIVHVRLLWRRVAELVFAGCGLVYIIGHVLMVYVAVKKRSLSSFQMDFLYLILQIGLMFMCTVPFALFDLTYLGDYLFPIWGMIGVVLFLFIVTVVIRIYQKKKEA